MKRLCIPFVLFPVCIALLVSACKKNSPGNAVKETVLSKVFVNGVTDQEFQYNSKKQLQKILSYNAAGTHTSTVELMFNEKGFLKEAHNYNAAGKKTSIYIYTTDAKGRFLTHESLTTSGADSGKITNKIEYTYNTDGRISKEAWVSLVSGKETQYRTYTWYKNGNLKGYEYYGDLSPAPELYWKTEYSPQGEPLPDIIKKIQGYPINFLLPYYTAENIHFYSYSGAVVDGEWEEEITGRKYDSEGHLTEQAITLKNLLPVQPKTSRVMKYEYKKL